MVVTQSKLDFSQPIATLLRQGTAPAHDRIETSEGAAWLSRGELDREEYVRLLMMLSTVYKHLERALEEHATHPTLAPTYNPDLLARSRRLSSDISFLLNLPDDGSWQQHPLHEALLVTPPPPLTAYTTRINSVSSASDPSSLLAHAYVRYLGDLSGGQIIRWRIEKAYGLDEQGLSFYDFDGAVGGVGRMGELKRIKQWFRDGMNVGVGDDVDKKVAIVNEANTVFDLNNGLFSTLKAPSSPITSPWSISTSKCIIPLPLGDPTTPTGSSTPTSEFGSDLDDDTIVSNLPPPDEPPVSTSKVYSVSSVATVILAVGLAHFIIIVGGLSGQKGYAKLTAVEEWLKGLFGLGAGATID
ncbi:hypothetical protein JAAARDRAFT_189926 [Jaapia argillacea MUCL 33604]|uniref:Uncharacterized protein n=1 Tax=Jaapia argillacea MUCL 33604 TaxID=933084 RepID=A0A067QGI9_9AGAM|nr:hypothetical protein JAAARDRAFT_189926 [Jaapia argillacea MUCL 33604]